MGKKAVKITLRSSRALEEKPEHIEQKMAGFLDKEGENWTLSWKEPPDHGLGDAQSLLTLCPGGVILTKTGEISAKMVFREGKTHTFTYQTPYGAIPMSLTAETVSWQASESGGKVFLNYSLAMDSGVPDRVELSLVFCP